MSITSFREMMEGKGCRIFIGFIMLALIASFFVPMLAGPGGFGGGAPKPNEATDASVVAKMGESPISLELIEGLVERNQQSMGQGMTPDQFPIALQSQFFYAPAVDQAVQGTAMLEIAKKLGLKLDEATVGPMMTKQVIDQQRDMFVQQGKLKAGATEAEFDAVLKKEAKMDRAAAEKMLGDQIKTAMADPKQKPLLLMQVANQLISEHFTSSISATDADLKKRYTTYNGKRIVLDKNKNTKEDLEKIRAEIVAKKLTFEDAMDKHTVEPPAKDKKARENVFQLSGDTAMVDPSYAEIPTLKAGDVSQVMSLPEGFVIMRFDGVSSDLPKDFDKNKATYVKQYKELIATRKMMDERDQILKDPKALTWSNKSFQAMFDWMKFQQDPEGRKLSLAERQAKLEEFYKMATEGAQADNPVTQRYGALAAVGILGALAEGATPEKMAELDTRRVELYQTLLKSTENPEMRLELATAFAKQKNPEGVAENLIGAVRGNFDYEKGVQLNSRVTSMLGDFEKNKQITPEGAKAVREAQRMWIQQREEFNKSKLEAERRAAEEKKAAEKQAAEAKKLEEQQKKATPPAPAGK